MLESSGRPDGVALPSRTAPPRSGQCDRAYRHTGPACPPSATREGPPGAPDAPITIGPLLDPGRVAPQGGETRYSLGMKCACTSTLSGNIVRPSTASPSGAGRRQAVRPKT